MSKVSSAAQADYANTAYQATIATMALEAQKLNQSGDMIIIDPALHYIQLVGMNQDPKTSIGFDLVTRTVYNLTVAPPDDTPETGYAQAMAELRLMRLEQRIAALENPPGEA
jgi:hypothetical protein